MEMTSDTGEVREFNDRKEFSELETWQEHIERSHLIPLSWHLGDGPKGSTLGKCDKESVPSDIY
jgi:hypothetical protein